MKKKNLVNRCKQGASTTVGTSAILAITAYRVCHEKNFYPSFNSVGKLSLITGVISGIVWSCMPRAKESPSETLENAKQHLYPALKVGVERVLHNEEKIATQGKYPSYERSPERRRGAWFMDEDREERRYGRRPFYPSKRHRYPGYMSDRSRFSGIEDDDSLDELISDEEFEEILFEDKLSDPFYEGSSSPFGD